MNFRFAWPFLLLLFCFNPSASPAQDYTGQVVIFLEKVDRAAADVTLRIDRIALQSDAGTIEIAPPAGTLDIADLVRQQVLLALEEIEPREYQHLLLRVTLDFPPLLPDSNRQSFQQEIDLPLDLDISPNTTRTVFLRCPQLERSDSTGSKHPVLVPVNKAIPPQATLAYLSNEGSSDVFILDRMANAVVGVIHVGRSPRGLALARTRNLLFVANAGSNSISVIDTDTRQLRQEINLDFGDEPEALCLSNDERRLYVADRSSNCVTVLDVGSMSLIGKIRVGNAPVDIAPDPSGNWMYVVNSLSDNVGLISVESLIQARTLEVGSTPCAIAFDSNRKTAYVANYNSGYLTEISTANQVVTANYSLSRSIRGLAGDSFSSTFYCAIDLSNSVALFKSSLGVELNEIPVGLNPHKVALDSKSGLLYVTCSGSNNVSVINPTAGRVVHSIPAGVRPYAIVFP